MSRHARRKSTKQVYHVMLRGNNKERIFYDEEDKLRIIDTLGEKKKCGEYILYAYCVMDNHIHLVIKEGNDPIDRIVKRIASSYSYYYNKKYKRIGHVFQERFKSESIEDESYLLTAVRYVHQNPVKSGLDTIEKYRWSSYRDYLGVGRKLTDTKEIINIISNNQKSALKDFVRFNNEFNIESLLDILEHEEIEHEHGDVSDYINGILKQKEVEINQLKSPAFKSVREEVVKLLLEKTNLSKRGIAITLGLNREMVRRIAVSRDLSP